MHADGKITHQKVGRHYRAWNECSTYSCYLATKKKTKANWVPPVYPLVEPILQKYLSVGSSTMSSSSPYFVYCCMSCIVSQHIKQVRPCRNAGQITFTFTGLYYLLTLLFPAIQSRGREQGTREGRIVFYGNGGSAHLSTASHQLLRQLPVRYLQKALQQHPHRHEKLLAPHSECKVGCAISQVMTPDCG